MTPSFTAKPSMCKQPSYAKHWGSAKRPLRERRNPSPRGRKRSNAGGDRAPRRSPQCAFTAGQRVAIARGGCPNKGGTRRFNGCANVPFAKPKHPKAGRGKRSDPQGVTARRGEVPQCAKKPSGQQGCPRSRGKCPKDKGGTRRSHQRTSPLPRWERVRVRVIDTATFANQRR